MGTTSACSRPASSEPSLLALVGAANRFNPEPWAQLRYLQKGDALFARGDAFERLYLIQAGYIKTGLRAEGRKSAATGFYGPDEFVGLDGLCESHHALDAVALESGAVWEMAYAGLSRHMRTSPVLHHAVWRCVSQQMVRRQELAFVLGRMGAEARVASFLLGPPWTVPGANQADHEIRLPVTRAEIAEHLGLVIETVSRALSRLQARGFIQIAGKRVRLLDLSGLNAIARSQAEDG